MEGLDFGEALRLLKQGFKVARAGWNGKGMYLQHVSEGNYMVKSVEQPLMPWIGMRTADGRFVPWLASQSDMLANDWVLIREGDLKIVLEL